MYICNNLRLEAHPYQRPLCYFKRLLMALPILLGNSSKYTRNNIYFLKNDNNQPPLKIERVAFVYLGVDWLCIPSINPLPSWCQYIC